MVLQKVTLNDKKAILSDIKIQFVDIIKYPYKLRCTDFIIKRTLTYQKAIIMKTITNNIAKIAILILGVTINTTIKAQVNSDAGMLNEIAISSTNVNDSKNTTGNEKAVALENYEIKTTNAGNRLTETITTSQVKPISFSAFPDDKDAGLIYLYSTQTCAMIEITDMDGKLVHTVVYENENQTNEPTYIDAPLTPGIYTISLRCENQVVAKQLVIK